MSTTVNISAGVRSVKNFIAAIGEDINTYKKNKNLMLSHWQSQFAFSIYEIDGIEYISYPALTTYNPYVPQTVPVGEFKWVKLNGKVELTPTELTNWNSLLNEVNEAAKDAAYKGTNLEESKKELKEAQKDFYKTYGDYPVYVKVTTYSNS